jgi:FkbM family methyltransferase
MSNQGRSFYQQTYSQSLRLFARTINKLLGRSAGKLSPYLPSGQLYQVDDYCGEFKFNVDTSYLIESTVWLSGVYDAKTTKFLQSTLRSTDVFLDIGANCGALTLVAASVIKTGQIYAFEAGPPMQSRLQKNLAINPQLDNRVQLVNVGLGQARGQLFYQEDPHFPGNGVLFGDETIQNGIQIDVITLDEWVGLNAIAKVDAIKIDVEGMEYEVFQGAKTLLTRDRPLIYFESMPNHLLDKSYSIADIYQYLVDLGYKILDPLNPYKPINWEHPPDDSLAICEDQLDRLAYNQ